MSNNGKYINATEAARRLGLERHFVVSLIKDGKLRGVKFTDTPKGSWRILESELEHFRTENQ